MAQSFLEQEREARAYNKAFLHGRSVGLDDGKKIMIDRVLEIIDEVMKNMPDCGDGVQFSYYPNGWRAAARDIRYRVLALKGGRDDKEGKD